jgi:hypothetical protein
MLVDKRQAAIGAQRARLEMMGSRGEAYLAFFFGTFFPARRASDRPMAIACFRLFTVFPEPLFKVPALRPFIVFSTFLDAA